MMEIGNQQFTLHFSRRNFRHNLQRRFQRWVRRRIPPSRNTILDNRNIFIIPSKQGMGFCFVLVLMFIAAINYEASLSFALVFVLICMFILSIFYTFRNLSGLHLSATPGAIVFAGEHADITIILNRRGKRIYEALELSFKNSRRVTTNLIATTEQRVDLYVPTTKRGKFSPGRLTIETFFPFGICRSWSLLDFKLDCLVYPKPIACDLDWLTSNVQNQGETNISTGNDDFHGLREYRQGDSLRHVAWKHFARGQGMYTKQYSSNVDDKIWLDWDMFPDMNIEDRISRLCYCVLKLDTSGLDYGLILPGVRIEPNKGSKHYTQLLETLALHGLAEENRG